MQFTRLKFFQTLSFYQISLLFLHFFLFICSKYEILTFLDVNFARPLQFFPPHPSALVDLFDWSYGETLTLFEFRKSEKNFASRPKRKKKQNQRWREMKFLSNKNHTIDLYERRRILVEKRKWTLNMNLKLSGFLLFLKKHNICISLFAQLRRDIREEKKM